MRSNIDIVLNKWKKVKQLDKPIHKTISGITLHGVKLLEVMAPVKTGRLKAGIHSRVYKKGNRGRIISKALGRWRGKTFPYNFWVNRTYKTIHMHSGARRKSPRYFKFKKGQKIRLPKVPRTYASTTHTGIPGYFTKTYKILKKQYFKKMHKNLSIHLKTSTR